MATETIAKILDRLKAVIESGEIRSPGYFLDEAQKLAILRQDLQAELVKAEINYRNEIVLLTNDDLSYNKAENMIKGRPLKEGEKMTAYQYYRYLQTRDDVVQEVINIAKKRATIEY